MQVSVSADIPGKPRMVYFRVVRDDGSDFEYGPVFTSDPDYDATAQAELLKTRWEAEANG